MWGLSLQFWQSTIWWANIVALIGALITGGALFVSAVLSSNVGDVLQKDADTRITEARTRGDEARAEAAKATERAAALEKEAAEAQLQLALLQKQVGPRLINRDKFLNALKGKRKPEKIFYRVVKGGRRWMVCCNTIPSAVC
jgi:hypothetical protein